MPVDGVAVDGVADRRRVGGLVVMDRMLSRLGVHVGVVVELRPGAVGGAGGFLTPAVGDAKSVTTLTAEEAAIDRDGHVSPLAGRDGVAERRGHLALDGITQTVLGPRAVRAVKQMAAGGGLADGGPEEAQEGYDVEEVSNEAVADGGMQESSDVGPRPDTPLRLMIAGDDGDAAKVDVNVARGLLVTPLHDGQLDAASGQSGTEVDQGGQTLRQDLVVVEISVDGAAAEKLAVGGARTDQMPLEFDARAHLISNFSPLVLCLSPLSSLTP